jgi:hypothetical protein
MKSYERPTICDGKVVTFARELDGKNEGLSTPKPLGPYEVSASRNAVIVHRCQILSRTDAEEVIEAIRAAVAEAEHLTAQGWGGGFMRAPRESLPSARNES